MYLEHHEAETRGDDEQMEEILNDEAHWTHCLDYIRQVSDFPLLSSEVGFDDSLSDMKEIGHPLRCRRYGRESYKGSQWEEYRQW